MGIHKTFTKQMNQLGPKKKKKSAKNTIIKNNKRRQDEDHGRNASYLVNEEQKPTIE